MVATTGRRLTNTADDTDIVNFSPPCPTIQSEPLRFRSFNDFSSNYISSPNKVITLIHSLCNITRRMAIANGTCVSFCNQPKAKFGYLTTVTPVCRCLHPFCGWRHLATSRESKAHFGLHWVRPWDSRGKCHMGERGFNACQTHRSITHLSSTCPTVIQPYP